MHDSLDRMDQDPTHTDHDLSHGVHDLRQGMPVALIDRWLAPVHRFIKIEAASGFVLIACAVLAMILANSPLADDFLDFWHLPGTISLGDWSLTEDLHHVINDGLMAIFFFVVGLEIKREMVAGELRSMRQAALPVIAALGGMLVPMLIYIGLGNALNIGPDASRGWAVPMATDIAFVVGVLALFGKRIPFGLKIMLLSVAIVDDLGAVLVIAIAFTESIAWIPLGIAATGFCITYGLNKLGVRRVSVYVLVGIGIWVAVLKSGVHPTVAGVLLGLLTPASAWVGDKALREVISDLFHRLRSEDSESGVSGGASALSKNHDLAMSLDRARFAAREAVAPLTRLEHGLHPWVAFVIMPIFALANAGVTIHVEAATDTVAMIVAIGLLVGKPVGIIGFSWIGIKLGIATLPRGTTWPMFIAGGCLTGIGFTMAIFLATLSLPGDRLEAGKIGILTGSLCSGILGIAIMTWALKRQAAHAVASG